MIARDDYPYADFVRWQEACREIDTARGLIRKVLSCCEVVPFGDKFDLSLDWAGFTLTDEELDLIHSIEAT